MEKKIRWNMKFMLFLICLFCCLLPVSGMAGDTSETVISNGQTIYIPVYSHIYSGDREHIFYLAATLSIRNTDLKHAIKLLTVDYYDSKGKRLKSYLENPINLSPLSATRYIIKESDKSGGSGASFIVKWKSDGKVNAPIVESIMIGTKTQQGISFTSRGRVIEE